MTWTYSGDPATSDKDATRFYIQDTDTTDQQFQDAEINFGLAQYGSPLSTSVALCLALAAKYARLVDKAVGDLRISYSQRSKQYTELATRYRAEAGLSNMTVYTGGTSVADMQNVEQDPDRPVKPFRVGQFDDPPSDTRNVIGDGWLP
jgi:hypothetical protein